MTAHAARVVSVIRRVATAVALCAFVVSPDPSGAEPLPSASCGSSSLTVAQGGSIPGPSQLSNPTSAPVIFRVIMRANTLFGAEHEVMWRLVPAGAGVIAPVAIPVPYSTHVGTDRVVLDVISPNTGDTILGTCDYMLTVTVPYPDTIIVPLRLCVMEGAAEAGGQRYARTGGDLAPFSNYLTTSRTRVRELIQDASDRVWLPQAHIMFSIAHAPAGIPVLPDRDLFPSADRKSIVLGNVAARSTGDGDQKDVAADCADAWQRLYGVDKGILFTIVHAYSWSNGEVGISGTPDLRFWGGDTPQAWLLDKTGKDTALCTQPRSRLTVADVDIGSIMLIDPATPVQEGGRSTGYVNDIITEIAHELGHDLLLGHGNGLDDNRDGLVPLNDGLSLSNPGVRRYDQYCDALGSEKLSHEDPPTGICEGLDANPDDPASLMNPVTTTCHKLWPLQIEQARAAAKLKPGAVTSSGDPSGELLMSRPCARLPCGIPADVLTLRAELAETPGLDVTTFAHTVFGPIDASSTNTEYLFFADLDNDATTGCSPAALGMPTLFEGAEIVTRAHVVGHDADPTAWKCSAGVLVPLVDAGIRAKVSLHGNTSLNDLPPAGFNKVVVEMTNAARGPRSDYVRVQTVSRQLNSSVPLFRIPAAIGGGGVLSLVPPPGPECSLSPTGVQPGEALTVEALRLSPQQISNVFVGLQPVASGVSGADGALAVTFVLPASTSAGTRQISVATENGTLAVCALEVYGASTGPWTVATVAPEPNASGWNSGIATVSLRSSPGASGTPIRDLTYSASGAQTLATTTVLGHLASFTIGAEGLTTLSFAARDTADRIEGTERLFVKIDATPPHIEASRWPAANVHGWNNSAVTVHFSCEDGTSGVTACPVSQMVDAEGAGQSANGSTSDFAGNAAAAGISGINIDLTPPVVSYSGGTPEYTVDQTIEISCTASDALSGVLSETCRDIGGPAYSFPLGSNTFSATATDRALNMASGQVAFNVRVTFASLCTLVGRFSTQPGVTTSLCSKLYSARDAAARNNAAAKRGALAAFTREVAAQSGKALPSHLAGTFLLLAAAL